MQLIGLDVLIRINLYRLRKMGISIYGHRERRNQFINIRMLMIIGLLLWIVSNRVMFLRVVVVMN